MNGDDDLVMLDRLLAAGVSFADAWPLAIAAAWKGSAEPIQSISTNRYDDPPTVGCVCGTSFVFQAGATRARCPGCGCRYELIPPHGTSKNAGAV